MIRCKSAGETVWLPVNTCLTWALLTERRCNNNDVRCHLYKSGNIYLLMLLHLNSTHWWRIVSSLELQRQFITYPRHLRYHPPQYRHYQQQQQQQRTAVTKTGAHIEPETDRQTDGYRQRDEEYYARETTMKSSQFHASRRYVKRAMMKPRASILTALSTVYIAVNISLHTPSDRHRGNCNWSSGR